MQLRYAIVNTVPMADYDYSTTPPTEITIPAGTVVNVTYWDKDAHPNWTPGTNLEAIQSDALNIGDKAW